MSVPIPRKLIVLGDSGVYGWGDPEEGGWCERLRRHWMGLPGAPVLYPLGVRGDGLERVARLLEHPRFDPAAPNSVRAVLGGLAGNTAVFHAADGSGYRFMAARIADLDQRNPITASRLAKVFSRWQSYGPVRSAAMHAALEQLAAASLSPNTGEVVSQCLGAE
jgi:aminopeptidase N